MGIREKLNQRPALTGGVAVAVVVLAALMMFGSGSRSGSAGRAYYTTDDGATWFALNTSELTPFDHDGRPAVRAYLFACEDGKEFVGYLERYTDEAKAVLAAAKASKETGKMPSMAEMQAAGMRGRQLKKPADKDWVNATDMGKAMKVQKVTCADGGIAGPAH